MISELQSGSQSIRRGFLSRIALRLAGKAERGSLTLTLPDGTTVYNTGKLAGPDAVLRIRSWRMLRRIWSRGDLGFAESYIAGECDTPDLRALMDWALANEADLASILESGPASVFAALLHRMRPNTRAGSRRNIRRHYDLSNSFYETWLDPTMTYSSAWFGGDLSRDLEDAQQAKYSEIARTAGITRDHHVLEIGCGWGGFCHWAAREIGCRVTGITISQAQHDYAVARLEAAGLSHLVDIQLVDYRDVTGSFDAVVSIEMIEAVGEKYWPVYAETLRDRLRPGGRAVLQAITIDEKIFDDYRSRADFIQVHIFPGGMLTTTHEIEAMADHAGLKTGNRSMFGMDYAETLRRWRAAFEASWSRIESLGFDEQFRRMWRYYLVYCETGFDLGRIDVGLFALDRP
jgi:cyclopropane-fatty-acyl-phospholipid synthase